MPNIGLPELLIVLVIALVILGPKKLPEAGRSMGRGLREFKDSITGTHPEDQPKKPIQSAPAPAPDPTDQS